MKQPQDPAQFNYRQQFFDDAPVMYVATISTNEPSGPIVLDANNTFLNTLGYSREEVVGFPLTKFYTPESAQRLHQGGYFSALRAEFGFEERELVTAKGTRIPVMLNAMPLLSPQGDVIGTKAAYMEMSGIKKAQKQAQSEHQFAQLVFDTIEAIIIVVDSAGRIVRHNAAFEELKADSTDLDSAYIWDVFGPDTAVDTLSRPLLEMVIQQPEPFHVDLEWMSCAGESRVITWNFTPLLDLKGKVSFVVVTGVDVTNRVRGEERLKESELRFRQLAENIRDVFYISNLSESSMLYISPAYETTWGRTRDSLYANPSSFLESIHPADRERIQRAVQRQLEGDNTAEEYRIFRPDGTIRRIYDRSFPVINNDGEVYRVVGIAEDITERKQAEMTISHRLRLESLISGLSTQFIQSPPDLIDELIETSLAEIGGFVRAMRSYVLQMSDDGQYLSITHEWCAQDIQPIKEQLQNVSIEQMPDWIRRLRQGDTINIESQHTLAAGADSEIIINNDTYPRRVPTIMAVPLQVQGKFWGIVGIEAVVEAKYWIDFDLKLMKIMGEVIVHALQQRSYEAALRKNEELFLLLGTNSTALFYIFDTNLRHYRYLSSAIERIWGYDIEEARRNFGFTAKTVHPDDRHILDEMMTALHSLDQESAEAQYRVFFADGSQHWVWDRASAIRDNDGTIQTLVGVVEDITDQKQATLDLQRSTAQLAVLAGIGQQLVSNMAGDENRNEILATLEQAIPFDLAFVFDNKQHIRWIMDKTGALAEHLSTSVLQDLQKEARTRFKDKRHMPNECSAQQKIMTEFPFASSALYARGMQTQYVMPLMFNQEYIGTFCLMASQANAFNQEQLEFACEIADLLSVGLNQQSLMSSLHSYAHELERRVDDRTSELSRANSEIMRTSRMKDEFLANMSHELRTPLNAILVKTELMQEGVQGPLTDKQTRSLEVIYESSTQLLALINDILDLSKIEASMLELEMGKVSVSSLSQSAIAMVREMALRKNIDMQINGDRNTEMQGDFRRLRQILVNLLINAIKFTPTGGKIGMDVDTVDSANVIRFSIWDTGIGITETEFERLQPPFVQIDGGVDRRQGGTGVGLPLVQRLTELHGGRLEIESVPGEGSRFTVVLPRLGAPSTPDTAARHENENRPKALVTTVEEEGGNLLVVDDNEKTLESLYDYFTYHGYSVLEARNSFECLERLEESQVHIVIMDIQMPKVDGLETIRRIRKKFPAQNLPIIALTALTRPGDRERCLSAGANAYMPKPFSLEELRALISEHVTASRS